MVGDLALLVLAWPLALLGCLFVVTGALGLVRMPDLYTRLHASSLTDTGGTLLIGLALLLHATFAYGSALVAIKIVLVLAFTLYTAPTASHALAKTALLSGHVPVGAPGEPDLLDSPEAARRIARSRPDRDGENPPGQAADGAVAAGAAPDPAGRGT